MRVSFDIDETLICRRCAMASEAGRFPSAIIKWFTEPLRKDTRVLFAELRQRGSSIWIYTSSGRTPFQIWLWLFLYGIRVDGIVNDQRHRRAMATRKFSRIPSKFPPAFNIDLHVDDSAGVRMEGDQHGFPVVVVTPDDEKWTEKILAAVNRLLTS